VVHASFVLILIFQKITFWKSIKAKLKARKKPYNNFIKAVFSCWESTDFLINFLKSLVDCSAIKITYQRTLFEVCMSETCNVF